MPQNNPQAERSAKSKTLDVFPAAFAETGKQRAEDMISFQTELFQYLQEANQKWFARMQSEAAMASEFATKLAAARSIPETATIYQEWANRRIELLSQDGTCLFTDTKKMMEAGARMLGNGWAGGPDARA